MLADQATQLLTAFVDRELSQRQRKAVMRLLHKSSEAREMLRQLQENAHKLKQLPRRKIEPSLVDETLQAIAELPAQPKQPAVKAARRRWLPYVVASMAAALLIGALGIVYWNALVEPVGMKDKGLVKINPPDKKSAPPTPEPPRVHPMLGPTVEGTFAGASKSVVPNDLVFTARFSEFVVSKNSKSESIQQLEHEVERLSRADKAIHFDITVESNSAAMDRLNQIRNDLKNDVKINLTADPSAAKPIDDKKVQYLFYAENLTSDQVTQMMCLLGQSFQKSFGEENQKKVASPYQTVRVTPLAKDSAEIDRVAPKRYPQAGKHQVLIRIHQD
jgi:hypothetical protein